MKFLNKTKQLVLFCILMLSAYTFAQPTAQDLQDSLTADSLHADSLSKISLAADVDTSNVINTNKVEHIDAGIEDIPLAEREFFPSGFIMEIAYAAPSVIQVPFLGMRDKSAVWENKFVATGYTLLSVDVEFRSDGVRISDEMLWNFILVATFYSVGERGGTAEKIGDWIQYLMIGNTYWALSQNSKIGLFESHHFVDYLFSNAYFSEFWEFGWSQAVGLRFVYSGNAKDGGAYIDLGAHARITNKHFLFGVFVQLGIFGNYK